jgi:hypothetical protein
MGSGTRGDCAFRFVEAVFLILDAAKKHSLLSLRHRAQGGLLGQSADPNSQRTFFSLQGSQAWVSLSENRQNTKRGELEESRPTYLVHPSVFFRMRRHERQIDMPKNPSRGYPSSLLNPEVSGGFRPSRMPITPTLGASRWSIVISLSGDEPRPDGTWIY